MKATFIFDFDGTIADTFPLVVDISYQLSGGTRRLATKRIESLRRVPLMDAIRALKLRRRYLPRLILFTRKRMNPYMSTVASFDGVSEMIKALHDDGHQLIVLSSNTRANIQTFLESRGLAGYFTDIATVYYGSVFFKIFGLHKLRRRYKLRKDECYYVGNEPLDIRSAERSGIHAIGVTWSGQSEEELALAKPDILARTPSDIVKLARSL